MKVKMSRPVGKIIPPSRSVTRLGDFFRAKLAQIFVDFWAILKNNSSGVKTALDMFGQHLGKFCYFLFQHLVTLPSNYL